jgi:hypothetical protein
MIRILAKSWRACGNVGTYQGDNRNKILQELLVKWRHRPVGPVTALNYHICPCQGPNPRSREGHGEEVKKCSKNIISAELLCVDRVDPSLVVAQEDRALLQFERSHLIHLER